jgi:hypothetical protein
MGRTIGISLGVLLTAALAVVTFKMLSASRGGGLQGTGATESGAVPAPTLVDTGAATAVPSGEVHPALVVVDRYLSSTHRLPPTLGALSVSESATEEERQVFQATLRDAKVNAAWKCLQSTGDLGAEIDGTQDDPLSYTLALAGADATTAKVDVLERFGDDHEVRFELALIDGRWLITATSDFDPATIDCTLEPAGAGSDDL